MWESLPWWLTESLPERAPLLIILERWIPTLLTIALGAWLARVYFPRIQQIWADYKALSDRKRAIAEDVAVHFDRYISEWRRLVQFTDHFMGRTMSPEETARLESFIKNRTEARDALMAALSRSRLYFSEESVRTTGDFVTWEESYSAAAKGLPDLKEWRQRQDELLSVLISEI
ncbi:MAG: hypothetical protein AAGA15_14465 [Pseudomonadota bacterium]